MELAGSVSALGNESGRVNIADNSAAAAGVLVSGTHQVVGAIDGSGTTQVNSGSDLTADRIVQSALVIGGTAGSSALVTIAASDSAGNPLAAASDLPLIAGLAPGEPLETDAVNDSDQAAGEALSSDGTALGGRTIGVGVGGETLSPPVVWQSRSPARCYWRCSAGHCSA